ncbi:MAG: hypothetical protein EA402_12455 [Planctomycetota bacterium]|nr:MAG: hypothetical protein EA402_12455 [Planctomycetota bacterium]
MGLRRSLTFSSWGYALILCSILISWGLWLGSMWYLDDWYENRFKYPAKVGSHTATLLMCWAFILATRFRPVERLFGGLDKVYKAHRYIGEAAFFIVFLHPIFLGLVSWSEGGGFWSYLWFSDNWVRNTGIIALLVFTILVILSLYWKIRYHRWKRSHDFFGLLLVLIIAHGVMAQGEIMRYPLLLAWFALWCGIGLAAYVYIRLLYRWLGPQYDYVVERVEDRGDRILELHLKPLGRPLRHLPGQFCYISMDSQAVSREPHPFSISSPPESPLIRLSIKQLGDWTRSLSGSSAGELARIWGPYGHFADHFLTQQGPPPVLIGGGIGITPFLSMIASEACAQHPGPITMIYSTARKDGAVYAPEIAARAEALPQLRFISHISDEQGFMDEAYLKEQIGELRDYRYFLCGPQVMMDALSTILRDAKVPLERIISEDFDIR